jgi:hypothetical protein
MAKQVKKAPLPSHYWKAPMVTDWEWPIRVAVAADSPGLLIKMRNSHLAKTLTSTYSARSNTGKFDVLILENGFVASDFLLKKKIKIAASVVLVALDKKKLNIELPYLADQLREKTNASAVIFFKTALPLNNWYDRLIAELSHDKGIATAVKSFNEKGTTSFITKSIDKETRLSNYVKKWLHQVSQAPVASKAKVRVHTRNDSFEMTVTEAIEFMNKNQGSLLYEFESRTGTTVANIKKALKKPTKNPVKRYQAASGGGAAKKAVRSKPKGGSVGIKYKAASKKATPGKAAKAAPRKAAPKKAAKKNGMRSPAEEKMRAGRPALKPAKQRPSKSQKSYLLAAFRKPRNAGLEKSFLLPNSTYHLFVKMGKEDISFLRAPVEVNKEEVFTDPGVKEVIVSLEVRINTMKKVLTGKITWPRDDDSSMAKFSVTTGSKARILEAEIIAYHKNRMLQKAVLRIEVRKATSQPTLEEATFKVEAILRDRVDSNDNGTQMDAVIIASAKTDSTKAMAGRFKNKPLKFRYTPQMQLLVNQIKTTLENITLAASMPKKLNDPENIAVLYPLAIQGNKLYRYYLNSMPLNGPLQLVNNAGDYLPLDFAYTREAPSKGATLCEHAIKALQEGKCKGCVKNKADERKYICPFGFWALSQVVERHEYASGGGNGNDYILKSVPDSRKNTLSILKSALHGSSEKVDDAARGLRKKVNKFITDNCTRSTYARNWKEWAKAVPGRPDSLILIVHVEADPASTDTTMEIGADPLGQLELDERYIPAAPGKSGPFIILIGCETTNTGLYLFGIVTELFLRGASVVLSNITSIVADQAAAMVMELIDLLKKQSGKSLSFGETMLKLRQQLMAKGILAGLGLISHGDTKWNIKV